MALGQCAAGWTTRSLSAGIHREDRDIRVLYLDGAPAGFFDLKPHLPEEVELAYFGMMEHATGQGIGRWFLGAAIDAAWSYGPEAGDGADLHARPSGGAAALPEARLCAGGAEERDRASDAFRRTLGQRHAAVTARTRCAPQAASTAFGSTSS